MSGRGFAKGFGVGLVLAGAALVAAMAWIIPPLVSWLDPVVKWVRVLPGAALHSDGVGSFYLRTEKRRPGKPEFWVFFLVTELGQGIPLDTYRARPRSCDEERPPFMINHDAGDPWTQHYCFKLPTRLSAEARYQVIGETGHKAWPLGTVVVAKLPSFELIPSPVPYHNPFGGLH